VVLPGDAVTGAAGPATVTCERAGRGWRVRLAGRGVVIEDSIGMLHLAVLIGNPRQEIAAADLAAGVAGIAGVPAPDAADHHLLDAEAIASYRGRLRRLDAEPGALAPGSDAGDAARAEREWLVTQLASAAGLGGRPRSFLDDAERARVAVGKAIRRALTRITAADTVIGEHLRRPSVPERAARTGQADSAPGLGQGCCRAWNRMARHGPPAVRGGNGMERHGPPSLCNQPAW
jgi:hypothetical protein